VTLALGARRIRPGRTVRIGGSYSTKLRIRRRGSYELRVVGPGLRSRTRGLSVR